MSGKRHAERIRDLKKKTCLKGKRDVKKKMPRLQETEISTKRHAERNKCQKKRHAKRKRDLKKKTCQGKENERETSRKRCQDFKRKRFQRKGMPREMDVRKETCRER